MLLTGTRGSLSTITPHQILPFLGTDINSTGQHQRWDIGTEGPSTWRSAASRPCFPPGGGLSGKKGKCTNLCICLWPPVEAFFLLTLGKKRLAVSKKIHKVSGWMESQDGGHQNGRRKNWKEDKLSIAFRSLVQVCCPFLEPFTPHCSTEDPQGSPAPLMVRAHRQDTWGSLSGPYRKKE